MPGPASNAISPSAGPSGTIGHVRDAADIDEGGGQGRAPRAKPRRGGKPEPAARPGRRFPYPRRGNRRRPERQARRSGAAPSPSCTVKLLLRPVQNGLAVEADRIDAGKLDAIRLREGRDAIRVLRRDHAFREGQHAAAGIRAPSMPRAAYHRLPQQVPLEPRYRRYAQAGPNEWTASPSVSISATSTPSIEVPLISPIAFINPRLTQNTNALHGAVSATRSQPICRGAEDQGGYHADRIQKSLDFIQILKERGYFHQVSDEEGLRAPRRRASITAYIGFDCTAPSLHVGNLIGIMMLRVLQQAAATSPSCSSAAARPRSAIPPARTRAQASDAKPRSTPTRPASRTTSRSS